MLVLQLVSFTTFIVKLDSRIGNVEDFMDAGDRFTIADGELLRQELYFYNRDMETIKDDIKIIKTQVLSSTYHNG